MEKILVHIRFYEELNDFLPHSRKKQEFVREFCHHTSVKDLVESCGVPHTEVDLILVNGKSVPFEHQINQGDRISVYPVFESFDISDITRLQERPLRNLRFVADHNLGKLAHKMRLLGFDVAHHINIVDKKLLELMEEEQRIILSRNLLLLKRKIVLRGCFIRSNSPNEQARQVIKRFHLQNQIKPFSRCTDCNGLLIAVDKESVLDILEPLTKKYYHDFSQCQSCQKVYWPGSHFEKLQEFIRELKKDLGKNRSANGKFMCR